MFGELGLSFDIFYLGGYDQIIDGGRVDPGATLEIAHNPSLTLFALRDAKADY